VESKVSGSWLSKITADFRRRLPLLFFTVLAGGLAILAVTAWCRARGVPFSHVSRDAVEILKAPPYYGALSNLGILVWVAGAVSCIFGAALLWRRSKDRTWAGYLLSLGGLTAVLVLDDLFLLHETVLPQLIGVRQRHVLAGYAVLVAVFLVRHRKRIIQTEYPLLVTAFGFFSLSVISDGAQTRIDLPLHYGIEDGGKFLGILAWSVYSVRLSMHRVLSVLERRKARPAEAGTTAAAGPLWGGAQQPGTVERRKPVKGLRFPQSTGEWRP
jgi:hypothetical protein